MPRPSLLFTFLTGAVALTTSLARAEAPPPEAVPPPPPEPARLNELEADLGLGVLGVAYERVLAPAVSVRVAAQYVKPWYVTSDNVAGLGGEMRPFFFPWQRAPDGVYLSPFGRLDQITVKPAAGSASGLGWTAGLTAGYSFTLFGALGVRIGVGAQYWHFRANVAGQPAGYTGFLPDIDGVIGYRF